MSKFTEFDAKKLYKLYKKACKKSDKADKKSSEVTFNFFFNTTLIEMSDLLEPEFVQ